MLFATAISFEPLPRLSLANSTTPFLALANVPSMKHSSTSIFPLSYRSWANVLNILDNVPSSTQHWNRLWQVWYDANRSGQSLHRAPERKIHTIPFSMARSVWPVQHGSVIATRVGPAISTDREDGSSGFSLFHCSSCSSSRRGIGVFRLGNWLDIILKFYLFAAIRARSATSGNSICVNIGAS